jgi:hypothetical protein
MSKRAILEIPEMFIWEETIMSKRGQPRLYKWLTLTTLATVIGLGGAAQAETYGGGPIFAPVGAAFVACRVFNFGTTPVTVPTSQIFNTAGTAIPLMGNTCAGATLALGQSCDFFGAAATPNQYSCRAIVAGENADDVSGAVEIANANFAATLNLLPLLKH